MCGYRHITPSLAALAAQAPTWQLLYLTPSLAALAAQAPTWQLLSTLSTNEDLPEDPRAVAAAKAFGLVRRP